MLSSATNEVNFKHKLLGTYKFQQIHCIAIGRSKQPDRKSERERERERERSCSCFVLPSATEEL